MYAPNILLISKIVIVESHSIQFNTIQYNSIQFNSIQYNSIQFNSTQYNSIQYNSIQFNSTQYNSIQYNSIQLNPIQFNSIQLNSIQFNSIQFNSIYRNQTILSHQFIPTNTHLHYTDCCPRSDSQDTLQWATERSQNGEQPMKRGSNIRSIPSTQVGDVFSLTLYVFLCCGRVCDQTLKVYCMICYVNHDTACCSILQCSKTKQSKTE